MNGVRNSDGYLREPGSFHRDKTSRGSRVFASAGQVRLLVSGVVVTALLIGAEIVHYVRATDLGALDRMEVNADQDPQCKPMGSKYDYSCPFPGYVSVQMSCLVSGHCGDRNLSMPPASDAAQSRSRRMEREDKIASLAVEAPYSGGTPEWRLDAENLRSGGVEAELPPPPVIGAPKTMEEAQQVVWERNLDLARHDAEEWLTQHER
ncbi:hypothetical protein GCM10022270_02270 [Terriglobus aquaticus]